MTAPRWFGFLALLLLVATAWVAIAWGVAR